MIGRQAYRAGRDRVAADALYKAGRSALSRLAYGEGADLLRAALTADARITERDRTTDTLAVDIRLALREAFFAASRFDEIARLMQEAKDLARSTGDFDRARIVQRHIVGNLMAMGQVQAARPQAEELVVANDRDGAPSEAAEARFLLAQILAALGRYREAEIRANEVLVSLDGAAGLLHDQPGVTLALARMWSLWCAAEQGRFEEAKDLIMESQAVLGSDDPPFFRILAGIGSGLFWLRFGEYALAVDTLKTVLPMTEMDSTRAWFYAVASPLGLALVRCGCAVEALPLLETAVERAPAIDKTGHGMQVAHLAECLLAVDQPEKADRMAREAVSRATSTDDAGTRAYALKTLAMVLRAVGSRESFRQPLEEARRIAIDLGMVPLVGEIEALEAAPLPS